MRFDRKTTTNIWNAYKEVTGLGTSSESESAEVQELEEKKLDPVDDKANDKKFKDRKDKDIDNDGDVDSSDEYLHKRRKAISNKVKKEKGYEHDTDVVESQEAKLNNLSKKLKDKSDRKADMKKKLSDMRKGKGDIDYLRRVEEAELEEELSPLEKKLLAAANPLKATANMKDGSVKKAIDKLNRERFIKIVQQDSHLGTVKYDLTDSGKRAVRESTELEEGKTDSTAIKADLKKGMSIQKIADKHIDSKGSNKAEVHKIVRDWLWKEKGVRKESLEEGVLDDAIESKRLSMRDAIMSVWEGKTYGERSKGATGKEGILDKESKKSKDFVDQHTVDDEDKGLQKGFSDVDKAGSAAVKQAPERRGDQRNVGDKNIVR